MFDLLTASDDEALLREFTRFVEFWCGPPDRARPELPQGLPLPVATLVALNEERSSRPFDVSDRLLRPDELAFEENGDLFFVHTHQMGNVICARPAATGGEASAVYVDPPEDQVIEPLARFVVTWGLQQLVFGSPKDLHEVELVPVCEHSGLPLELLWEGTAWPGSESPFHLCNEQVLSFDEFNGYHAMDDDFRGHIRSFYPKLRPEYPE
jgi:hypothetical protein